MNMTFVVLVEVDMESVDINSDYVEDYKIRDDIECSFDEGNYTIVDSNIIGEGEIIELTDVELANIFEQYKLAKRFFEVVLSRR